VKNCPKLNFNPKEFFRCCCVANWKTIYHVLIPFSFMLKLYFKKCCCNTNLSAWHSESRGPNRVPHAPPLWYTHKLGKKWTVVTSSECESFLSFFSRACVWETSCWALWGEVNRKNVKITCDKSWVEHGSGIVIIFGANLCFKKFISKLIKSFQNNENF
jgi:hypothetical protein